MRDNQLWMTADGEPIQGMTPPRLVAHNAQATRAQVSMAASELAKFNTVRRLSPASSGYHAQGGRLADGTAFRITSVNNVVRVDLWPTETPSETTTGEKFWCQPWDSGWLAEAYDDVYTMPEWFVIDDSNADTEDDSTAFLSALERNEEYEPPRTSGYPGNQTWFAPPGHPSEGLVVSWWGQHRRYSDSALDQSIDLCGAWRRSVWPSSALLYPVTQVSVYAPTGGVAGAVAGTMFHTEGAVGAPGGPQTPVEPARSIIWLNGAPIEVPLLVSSACVGYRDNKVTIRAVGRIDTTFQVLELSTDGENTWNLLATLNASADAVGLPHSEIVKYTTNGATNGYQDFGFAWNGLPRAVHPFYWNADGTEAMAVVRYDTVADSHSAKSAHALLKIAVTASDCTLTLAENSKRIEESQETYSSSEAETTLSRTLNNTLSSSGTSTYVGVIAADYRGNDPIVLRTHVSLASSRSQSYSENYTGTQTASNLTDDLGEYVLYYRSGAYNKASSITESSTIATKASANGTAIPGTTTLRTTSLIHSAEEDAFTDNRIEPDPGYIGAAGSSREYVEVPNENWKTTSGATSWSGSGAISVWGISAGDLRADYVIQATPLDSREEVGQGHSDFSFTSNASGNAPTGGGGSSSTSATFSKTLRTDIGSVLHVSKNGTVTERTKLIHPIRLSEIGNGTYSKTEVNGGGAVENSTSTGPYGGGPVWTDFHPDTDDHSTALDGSGTTNTIYERTLNCSRDYADAVYPQGAPYTASVSGNVQYFVGSGAAGPGGYANTALVGGALTPDGRTQYIGALFVAMAAPSAPTAPITYRIDEWRHDGDVFVPEYPEIDEEPFPHRESHTVLLNPIFIGPLP